MLPVYAVGITWLLYALFFPLYKGVHYLIAAALSAGIYYLVRAIAPKQLVTVEKKLIAHTKNARVNEVIDEANKNIAEIRRLNGVIADAGVSAKIEQIDELTVQIFDNVIKNPDNISAIRRFISYYLPTTIKLLSSYADLAGQKTSTDNIKTTMEKIDGMLSTVIEAFKKQLDSLYASTALDVASEISVMENILSSEGLAGGESFTSTDGTQTSLKL